METKTKTNKKILFMDLDDTLLNYKKEITEENSQAIAQALAQGHLAVINTGRPLIGAIQLVRSLGLDQKGCYAITYNGGLIYDCYEEKPVYKKSIPLSYVAHIFREAARHGLFCQTYTDTHLIAPAQTPELEAYVTNTHVPFLVDSGCPESLTEDPVKVLIIDSEDHRKSDAYRSSIEEWARDKVSIFFSSGIYLEHVAAGVSKGDAMKELCRILDIPLENTVAVGDAENDLPMLETAHIGVAMANATSQVKDVADYITHRDCNHSGVAEVVEKFILD